MVARRKKLKEQVAAGDANAEERRDKERKLKVQKRKEKKKKQQKKEEPVPDENAEEVKARKEAKRLKKEERKNKRKEVNESEAAAVVDGTDVAGEDGKAPAVKKRKVDEAQAGAAVENEEDPKAEAEIKEEPRNNNKKKKKNKKSKVDRWGAPIVEEPSIAPAAEEEDTTAVENHQSEEAEVQYELKKVYVGGMPYNTTEDDIYNFFAECGAIDEIDCTIFPDTGKFRGLAFITFKTELAAKKALELDGADMGGRYLRIQKCLRKEPKAKPDVVHAEPPPKIEGCTSVYIGNLSWDITEKDLRNFFRMCKIQEIRLVKDRETGEFRGYGHVDFKDDESVEKAMKLNQWPLLNRSIKIAYAVPKRKKQVS